MGEEKKRNIEENRSTSELIQWYMDNGLDNIDIESSPKERDYENLDEALSILFQYISLCK